MLPPWATSMFVSLKQQEFVTTKGQLDITGLGCRPGDTSMSEGYAKQAPLSSMGILRELTLEAGEEEN